MTDQELFKTLVDRNILDPEIATRVLKDASFSQRSAEELLYERRVVDEVAVARAKTELLGAPYKKIDATGVTKELLEIIPRETAMTYRVAPLELTKNLLVVGMLHPDDERAQEALKFTAKQRGVSLGVYLVTMSDLQSVWRLYGSYQTEVEAAVRELGNLTGADDRVALEEGGTIEDAPVIKIVASTLRQAVEGGASDVHIEPQRSRLRVRFRIDGELQEVASLPSTLAQPVISRVKVLAHLKLDENRVPQDGRFRTVLFGRDIDFRVATFPTPSGEKVALRVLDPTTGLRGFDQLGLNEHNARVLENAITRPYGMILISGPTGSGKTTTLYAMMQRLNNDDVNILSLEDPVEYFMEGINQSQVKPEIGYDFNSGLREILRQDPDVIMVGEIRDGETASLAVNTALTGHIMLSTIHTNNAIGVIPRLVDLGTQPFLLSSALNLMIAQRLVLRLCPECRKPSEAPLDVQKFIAHELEALPADARRVAASFKPPYTIFGAPNPNPSCKVCKGKGTSGRMALFEFFEMTRELSELINTGFTEGKLMDLAKKQGIVTIRQDGVLKALGGEVSIEQVLLETAS